MRWYPYQFLEPVETLWASELGENLVSGGDGELAGVGLDSDALDLVIFSDDDIAFGAGSTEDGGSIERETDGLREGSGVVSDEVNLGAFGSEGLLPCFCDENIVDGEDVNFVDTLGLELLVVVDVTGNLGVAGACESARDTNDDVLALEDEGGGCIRGSLLH